MEKWLRKICWQVDKSLQVGPVEKWKTCLLIENVSSSAVAVIFMFSK